MKERENVWVKCAYFSRWKRESQHLQNNWFEFVGEARHTGYAKTCAYIAQKGELLCGVLIGLYTYRKRGFCCAFGGGISLVGAVRVRYCPQ